MDRRLAVALALLLALVVSLVSDVRAQDAAGLAAPERLTQPEVLKLLDAYAVVQAQEALGLDTAHYGVFVANYRQLLETRRRHRAARVRALAELGRLARSPDGAGNEALLRERLKSFDDLRAQSDSEVRAATDVVLQPLTVGQRARFLVFEEQIERRKLELLARAARGALRPGGRRQLPQ